MLPPQEVESIITSAHIPEGSMREGMRTTYANYDQYGFPGGNALVLRAILGREPRTLQEYTQALASRKASL